MLPPPEHLIRFFPSATRRWEGLISQTRKNIHNIMAGDDDRLLVIIGPAPFTTPQLRFDYARRPKVVRERYMDTLEIVMRVLRKAPHHRGLEGPDRDRIWTAAGINRGAAAARGAAIGINCPAYPGRQRIPSVISPSYIADRWPGVRFARTESQSTASWPGLSVPVG